VGIGAGDDEFEGEFDNEFDGDLETDYEGDDVLIPDDASGRRKSSGAVLDWSDDDGDEATDDATDDATE
jgi:hypothetical protein